MREKNRKMSELKFFLLIVRKNMEYFGEIYTTSKNFTLPPAVTGGTNLTSGIALCLRQN